MNVPLVIAALLCCGAGEAWGDSVPPKIQAFAGEAAILPCSTPVRDVHPTVEWSKEGLNRSFALVYRDGCETHEEKNPVFCYRTSLIMNELKNGNISLRISNVQPSDAGTYRCRTIWQKVPKDVMVELSVGEVSEPKLSVVPAAGGGVTLQCEAERWFLQPNITFVDDRGHDIDAEEPKVNRDFRGRFTVSRRMTQQTHTNRIFCKVHQPQTNQPRVAQIYIPDECMNSCTTAIVITAVVAIFLCALTAIICWQCGRSDLGQKLPLCQRNHRNSINTTTELLRRIDELKLSPPDIEMMIRHLTEKLNDLRKQDQPATHNSPSRPVPKPFKPPPQQIPKPNNSKPVASTSSDPPKSGNPPQNKDLNPGVPVQNRAPILPTQRSSRDHSSPASTEKASLPPSPTSAFASEGGSIERSQSVSGPRANSKKPQRRNTISTANISNRFSLLAELGEDNEPLL